MLRRARELETLITSVFSMFINRLTNGLGLVVGERAVATYKLRKMLFYSLFHRAGSVVIIHRVFYTYNDMIPSDRVLSPSEIYDKTLGPSVNDKETVEDFKFTECSDCEDPTGIANNLYVKLILEPTN